MEFAWSVRLENFYRCVFITCYLHAASASDVSASVKPVPKVTLQGLNPKGFRTWINDAPGIKMFVFQGNINTPIKSNDGGTITGEVSEVTHGMWLYENSDIQLKAGDTIYYHVFVNRYGTGYSLENQSFTIKKLVPVSMIFDREPICEKSLTKVKGKTVCTSEILFEDEFDLLDTERWQIEQYIPKDHPEFPFMSYQHSVHNPTVQVDNGYLHISAKLQENMPGFNIGMISTGPLNIFQGCTKPGELCLKTVTGADIIPPVVTGRIRTKMFSFKYGTVYIRAKMPKGDWLYPEILLEPVGKKYGAADYYSGILKIAVARGNTVLYTNGTDYSNKVLYGGPIIDSKCCQTLLQRNRDENKNWGDDFHLYVVTWAPDGITLSVDGKVWGHVDPGQSALRDLFSSTCGLRRDLLSMGTTMAPFDEPFYITLSLAVGGVSEFPDDSYTTNGHRKPWRNGGRKAMMSFWQDTFWLRTWTQPELVIDYVRVVAL